MNTSQVVNHTQAWVREEEFMHLPRDGRKWELIDGEAKEVPAGHEHDAIGIQVAVLLKPFVRGRGVLAGSQAGFRMASGNIRSPDVSFTRKERLPEGKPSKGFEELAPDLAVEVLSPNDDVADLPRKVNEYFQSGAEQVWLLEPEALRVTVYTAPTISTRYERDEEFLGGSLLPGFRCRAVKLFDIN